LRAQIRRIANGSRLGQIASRRVASGFSQEQADQILTVAHEVEISCYDETLRPDHEALVALTACEK